MNVCVSTEKNSPISPARSASFADPCHQTQGWVRALRRRAQSSPIRVVAFFFVKDKISASTTRNYRCRSAPNTSLNKRTSPSLGEFANMERHLHDQTATTFSLRRSGTSRTLAETTPCKNWFASTEYRPTHFGRDHRRAHVPRCQPALGTFGPSFFVLPPEQHHPVCCMAPGGPICPDGGHQSGVDCQLGASHKGTPSDDFQSPTTRSSQCQTPVSSEECAPLSNCVCSNISLRPGFRVSPTRTPLAPHATTRRAKTTV